MKENYKPRYSGPNRSGICVCGHSWEEHHLGVVMDMEYARSTGEGYLPQECEAYGFNEAGGMVFNKASGLWEDHCFSYRDSKEMKTEREGKDET